MLDQTVTHYFPWDESDDAAVCGHPLTAADTHSAQPTCARCAAKIAEDDALEALIELAQLPLDADEARTALDPLLNAGVPACPDCDGVGHYTVTTRQHPSGEREVGCERCAGTGVRAADDAAAPSARPMSPVGADLFAFAVALNRRYAALVTR